MTRTTSPRHTNGVLTIPLSRVLRTRSHRTVGGSPGEPGVRRLIYVLAASHSGSTLLTMLLGAHADLCTTGELKSAILGNVEEYRCSCGERIRRCPFWARVRAGMAQRALEFDLAHPYVDLPSIASPAVHRLLKPLHRGALLERARDAALWLCPAWRREYPIVQHRTAALVNTICDIAGQSIIVDSSKYGLRLKYLLRNPALDVQIVRLVRDGRAVAATYYVDEGRLPMRAAAHEWRRSNEEAEQLLASVDPARWTEVRYEHLCADPAGTLTRLFEFIGVDPARATLDFRARAHHVIGNWMRTQTTAEIRLDERWREQLSPADLHAFDAVAGRMNRGYGYE
jgi:hypothetical protein